MLHGGLADRRGKTVRALDRSGLCASSKSKRPSYGLYLSWPLLQYGYQLRTTGFQHEATASHQ